MISVYLRVCELPASAADSSLFPTQKASSSSLNFLFSEEKVFEELISFGLEKPKRRRVKVPFLCSSRGEIRPRNKFTRSMVLRELIAMIIYDLEKLSNNVIRQVF